MDYASSSGAPRGVSWLPGNPPKCVKKKKKYCIVINFEKREGESYIDVYVIPSLSSQSLSLYGILFSHNLKDHSIPLYLHNRLQRERRERERERLESRGAS